MTRSSFKGLWRLFGVALATVSFGIDVSAQDTDPIEPPSLGEIDTDSTLRDALEMLADDDIGSDPLSQSSSESLFEGRIPGRGQGGFELPPLAALTTSKTSIGDGSIPEGFRGDGPVSAMPLPESGNDRGLALPVTFAPWAAANTFSHPLYFEDRMLERHGHVRLGHFQPLASGARFLAQTAMLPYLSTLSAPCECEYSLGYYRTGSCVPALKQRPPYSRKAAAAQLTTIAVGATILP